MAFVKLDQGILRSSVWDEDSDTRVVWVTLMAMADRNGMVEASAKGVAHEARVELAKTVAALEKFEGPDPFSKTEADLGQRILRVEGGWVLLNYEKYREKLDEERRREQVREAVRRHRGKKKPDEPEGNGGAPALAGSGGAAAPEATSGEALGPPYRSSAGAPADVASTPAAAARPLPGPDVKAPYFQAIEERVLGLTGRLQLSSAEVVLIDLWWREEIPLRVVLAGIDGAQNPAPGVEREPRTLLYFREAVLEEAARAAKAGTV